MEQIPNKIITISNESNELCNKLSISNSNDKTILDEIQDERIKNALEKQFIGFNEGIEQEISSLEKTLNNEKRLFVGTTLAIINKLIDETTKVINNNGKKVCIRIGIKDKVTKTKFSESNKNKIYPNDISYGINIFKELMNEKGYYVKVENVPKCLFNYVRYIYVVSFDL